MVVGEALRSDIVHESTLLFAVGGTSSCSGHVFQRFERVLTPLEVPSSSANGILKPLHHVDFRSFLRLLLLASGGSSASLSIEVSQEILNIITMVV